MIMTEFDKLIKEKAEQAAYNYKPSAWRRFKHFAGTSSPVKYWVLGSVSAVVVGGAVFTAIHFSPKHSQPEEVSRIAMTVDSARLESAPEVGVVEADFCPEQTVPTVKPVPTRTYSSNNDPNAPQKTADPSSERKEVSVPVKSEPAPVRLGRPLVIDVDTIKDNVPSDEELRKGNSRLF